MIVKVTPAIFEDISQVAPSKPAIHLFIAKTRGKKQRYVLMWKDMRFSGESAEEIKAKLKVFQSHFNYFLTPHG